MNYSKIYKNGNYLVYTIGDELKKRTINLDDTELISEFPDSLDVKISNKCSFGCKFCHESSLPNGEIGNIEKLKSVLSILPNVPIEIAIGGGDVLDSPEETLDFIGWAKNKGFQPRITINHKDLFRKYEKENIILDIFNNIDSVGISITDFPDWYFNGESDPYRGYLYDILDLTELKVVFHIISGIYPGNKLNDIFENIDFTTSVLILGYKTWGRAKNTKLPDMSEFETNIKEIIKKASRYDISEFKRTVGFDNLAIEQLNIRDIFDEDTWNKIYMGDEGTHSMYIDSVNGEFAINSRSPERTSWNDTDLITFFKSLRK